MRSVLAPAPHPELTSRLSSVTLENSFLNNATRWSSSFEGYPLQTAKLPESGAGDGVIKPASSFVIQNRQTSCSMWCPMYRARC